MISQAKRIVLGPPSASRASQSLPDDLLAAGATRLRVLSYLVSFGAVIVILMMTFAGDDGTFGVGPERLGKQIVFGVIFALSLTLGVVLPRIAARRIIDVGLAYFALIVALLGAYDATSPFKDDSFAHGLPMVCIFLLAFPMLVPMPPRRFATAALIGTAGLTLAMAVVPSFIGLPAPPIKVFFVVLVPVMVIGAFGYIGAGVIYSLGKDLKRARKLGSYQLIEPLGQGGMGEVWRATHGMLARSAAIKLIRRDTADSPHQGAEALSRFEHEARVVANLRSPHTIQLWDFGQTSDGALYYAMELLDGMDFDKLVQLHGPVAPERVVHFLVQACHSLAEAHEAGHVHRDIKPANLFTAKLGRDLDVVKVLDFGLATRPVLERLTDTRVTLDGAVMGTPAFMAPEQALGANDVDGRADIYALGTVAWWLLTGRDLFQGQSATQVMFAHVYTVPEPPSKHAPQSIPAALDAIVLRCLAKRPEERYQSAEDLAVALRAVELAEPWTRARAMRWWADPSGAEEVRRREEPIITPTPKRALAETVQAGKPAA